MFRLFWRNHLSLAHWLLNNATLSANELEAVRNVRRKLERNRTCKPSPGQKKWLKKENARGVGIGSCAPASKFALQNASILFEARTASLAAACLYS
jgi:hypothetical protein